MGHRLKALAMATSTAMILLGTSAANAIAVNYRLVLTVESTANQTPCPNNVGFNDEDVGSFTCKQQGGNQIPVEPGDQFVGRFQIEQDVSSLADGIYDIELKSFRLEVGTMRFFDFGGYLAGWRRAYECAAPEGMCFTFDGPTHPGFHVSSGEISAFAGGSFAPSDIPNLDFFGTGSVCPRSLVAHEWCGNGLETWGFATGTYLIARVAEPGTLALVGLGLVGLGVTRRKKAS